MIAVPLRNRHGETVAEAILDDADEGLTAWRWYRLANGYTVRTEIVNGRKRMVYLHRAVVNAPAGTVVDHKNRDRLDCRRSNIRLGTQPANMQNRGANAGRVLPRNVYPKGERFIVQTKVNGRSVHIGCFGTVEEAAGAADRVASGAYAVES